MAFTFIMVPTITEKVFQENGLCDESHIESSEQIYSMHDNADIDGHFFLGSGGIGTERVYVTYIEIPDGSIVQKTYPVDSSKIFMDTEENPYVLYKWRFNCAMMIPEPFHYFEFHIPNGTVIKEFKLDGAE